MFSALPDEMSIEDQHKFEAKIDEVCWSICSSNYVERDNPLFPDECVYKLYRVFCMLGDMVENDEGKIEVKKMTLRKKIFKNIKKELLNLHFAN